VKIHIAIAGLPEVLVFSVKPNTANPMDTYRACLNYMEDAQSAVVETIEGEPFIEWLHVRAVWFTDDTADVSSNAEGWTVVTEDPASLPPDSDAAVDVVDSVDWLGGSRRPWNCTNSAGARAQMFRHGRVRPEYVGDRWRLAREGE